MSIFPFMQLSDSKKDEMIKELPLFQEYAYDYKSNRLLLDKSGNTYLVSGNDALKIWIYKALMTVRYKYLAYSDSYGNETQSLLGVSINYDIMTSELERFIIETLYFNDYIREIKDFNFKKIDAGIYAEFIVTTVYGQLDITYQTGGVQNV